MRRPVGVTVLAVLAIIFGVLNMVAALAALFAPTLVPVNPPGGVVVGSLVVLAVFALVLGIFMVATGIGALLLKPWAWTGLLIVTILIFLDGLVNLFALQLVTGILNVIVAALIAYLLFTPEVQQAFSRHSMAARL